MQDQASRALAQPSRRGRLSDLGNIARYRPLQLALFGEVPLIVAGWLALATGHGGPAGADFAIFRHAGTLVLHGRSPYVAPSVTVLADKANFVYPAPFAYVFAPFALIGQRAGAILFLAASVAALFAALRLLGITDWRLYGVALLVPPVFDALGVGSISLWLLLGVAASWRLRDSRWGGIALGVTVAVKLFLWPLLLWVIIARRFQMLVTAGVTVAVLVVVWAATQPGLSTYPRMLRALELAQPSSYSPRALWLAFGLPGADVVVATVAVVGAAAVGLVAYRAGERAAFAAAIVVSLFATPLLWLHYLVLLFVPLAFSHRRLSWAWLLLALMWITPGTGPGLDVGWKAALVLAVTVAVVADCARGHFSGRVTGKAEFSDELSAVGA
jgi:hypothetical protein